ncbi:MAG: BamA/TamA family outer membrane protein [Alphaproteobacteria bacterium]|nr:BamA/TamA family outer membrane protein [Alphaproteobacteria bacterium]
MLRFIKICCCFFFISHLYADDTLTSVTYDFSVEGITNNSIERKFDALSNLILYKDSPVYSIQNLEKRIAIDYDLLYELLDSKGFYDAKIDVTREVSGASNKIIFKVKPGKRYRIKTIKIELHEAFDDLLKAYPYIFEDLPAKTGNHVSSEKIHETFEMLEQKLSHVGYPYAKVTAHSVELNPVKHRIELKIEVTPGPRLKFGELKTEGQENVPSAYILNRAPWQRGEYFDARKIDLYRSKLSKSRLFEVINIEYPEQPNEGEDVPLMVNVREQKFRTLSTGLKYSMNERFSASGSWIHRNFMGKADRLKTTLSLGQVKSKLELNYEVPDFYWVNKTLAPSFEILRENNNNYFSQSAGLSTLLRTEFGENDEYFYGVSLDLDRVRKDQKKQTGHLVGVPIGFSLDDRDDFLDPSRGYLLSSSVTPKLGKVGNGHFMLKGLISGSIYHSLSSRFVVATWGRGGAIAITNLSDVLPNQRFYAGGGGSVRGYSYQKAGPLDAAGKPTGGRSLLEGGVELRCRLAESWGAVAFFEGAKISANTLNDLKNKPLFGAGVGLRYYTRIGPIRLDVAVPLEKRKKPNGKSVDGPVQFFISIGQGF